MRSICRAARSAAAARAGYASAASAASAAAGAIAGASAAPARAARDARPVGAAPLGLARPVVIAVFRLMHVGIRLLPPTPPAALGKGLAVRGQAAIIDAPRPPAGRAVIIVVIILGGRGAAL